MLSIVKSMSLHGLNVSLLNIEVDISGGLPSWEIVRIARYKCKRIKRKNKSSYKKYRFET